jgi:hypothetical protein
MLFYYGKRYDAAKAGQRIVKVGCDRCGCEYFYELTRVGAGAASAPYGIGTQSAIRQAQAMSEQDVQKRLAHEADLVPCPSCNWINDELVQGYRRGRYRGLSGAALLFGILGTASALICGWYVSIGPPADRGAVPYIVVGGPVVVISFACALLVLRSLLRRLIQPNRRFPQPPKLPRGSPPALVLDNATGALCVAESRRT